MPQFLIEEAQIRSAIAGEGVEIISPEEVQPGDVIIHMIDNNRTATLDILSIVDIKNGEVCHGAYHWARFLRSKERGLTVKNVELVKAIPMCQEVDADLRSMLVVQHTGVRNILMRVNEPKLGGVHEDEFRLGPINIELDEVDVSNFSAQLKPEFEKLSEQWAFLAARKKLEVIPERGLTIHFKWMHTERMPYQDREAIASTFGKMILAHACLSTTYSHNNSGFKVSTSYFKGHEDQLKVALEEAITHLQQVYLKRGIRIDHKTEEVLSEYLI